MADKKLKLNKDLLKMDVKDFKKLLSKNFSKNQKRVNPLKTYEKKREVVAFDFGSQTIKIVQGIYYKGILTINKCVTMETPKNSIVDGVINRKDTLVREIKRVLDKNNIKVKDGICTTNSTSIINREILIPVVSEDEMDTVVKYEIQQYLPINLDECILQVMVLDKVKDFDGKNKQNVRVVAYPKTSAGLFYNLLIDLGLRPFVLDVNFNSLNKLVNLSNLKSTTLEKINCSTVFIDFGASTIDVNIYKNKQLDFTRIIKTGGFNIDEAIITSCNYESEQVENVKRKKVNLKMSQENMNLETLTVKTEIDEWIEKIEMILKFYNNQSVGNYIDEIIIFGGSSRFQGLSEYMEEKLGMQVKTIQCLSNITFKNSEDNGEDIGDFINAIGSIIRI